MVQGHSLWTGTGKRMGRGKTREPWVITELLEWINSKHSRKWWISWCLWTLFLVQPSLWWEDISGEEQLSQDQSRQSRGPRQQPGAPPLVQGQWPRGAREAWWGLCPPAGSWTGSQRRGGSSVWRKILVIGSDQVREQVWAALAWLQILAVRGLSVQQLMEGTLGRVRQKFLYQIQLWM